MIGLLIASLIVQQSGDIVIPPQAFAEIVCLDTTGITVGTAFRIGPALLVSVNHVTAASAHCFIDGKPVKIEYKSATADFSLIDGDGGPFIKIDCGGFIAGGAYSAIGHARGLSRLTAVELTATGETMNGNSGLRGMFAVVPGQSGGPVLDSLTGAAVGVIEAENFEQGMSWALPLSATPVCKGKS